MLARDRRIPTVAWEDRLAIPDISRHRDSGAWRLLGGASGSDGAVLGAKVACDAEDCLSILKRPDAG
jgi:hypothetical protein